MTNRVTINLAPCERDAIDKAARSFGLTNAEFVQDVALRAARLTVEGRGPIVMNEEAFAAFTEEANGPSEPVSEMVRFMSRSAPWEAKS